MPRNSHIKKRTILPDPVYNNLSVHTIINRILKSGKKTLAYKIVYDGFKDIEYTTGKNPNKYKKTRCHIKYSQVCSELFSKY